VSFIFLISDAQQSFASLQTTDVLSVEQEEKILKEKQNE